MGFGLFARRCGILCHAGHVVCVLLLLVVVVLHSCCSSSSYFTPWWTMGRHVPWRILLLPLVGVQRALYEAQLERVHHFYDVITCYTSVGAGRALGSAGTRYHTTFSHKATSAQGGFEGTHRERNSGDAEKSPPPSSLRR
ncbi:hypothetical protein BS50DRAFT_246769 [Corynespora cassiicola Philippines]|uniref:Uncharacterized protein n=1 Tax=Corynespora cassiicola Philippines TaxID=1448308 RepID=A0A2T2P3J5_CORCC|nr:hypothetical protein BS50DRAFT_246769 [Corynespora cassiicola Philippines]